MSPSKRDPSSGTPPSPNHLLGLPSPHLGGRREIYSSLLPPSSSSVPFVCRPAGGGPSPLPECAVPMRTAERHRPSRHTGTRDTAPRGHPPSRWPRRATSPHGETKKPDPQHHGCLRPNMGQGLAGNPKHRYVTRVASNRANHWRAVHELQHLGLVGSVVISFFSPFLSFSLNFAFIASSC